MRVDVFLFVFSELDYLKVLLFSVSLLTCLNLSSLLLLILNHQIFILCSPQRSEVVFGEKLGEQCLWKSSGSHPLGSEFGNTSGNNMSGWLA